MTEEAEVRVVHLKVNDGHLTMACRGSHPLAGKAFLKHTADVGVAFCSPKDTFDPAKGEMIARGRLDKPTAWKRLDRAPVPYICCWNRAIYILAEQCRRASFAPAWAKKGLSERLS